MAHTVKQQRPVQDMRLQPAKPRLENRGQQPGSGWWCVAQESDDSESRDRKGRTVIVSDIHIGTNAKTCWYQKSVHEGYLASLFDYVVAHGAGVDDPVTKLIILGDLFDSWTYSPDVRPPAIEEIIAANPRILGADGKLSKAVQAVRGNVVYLRGNHDIGMTQGDLNQLPLGNYQITLIDDDVMVDESGLVLTHGHLFTMFNAPDPRYPGEVPVGHFVSRAIAHLIESTVPANQTAANFAGQDSPYGLDLGAVIPALVMAGAGPSITNLFLDYIAARCGLSETAPILMADGSSTTIQQVKIKYNGLWELWVGRYGGGEAGETIAAKAVKADYSGDYMAWFAQKAAWDHAAPGAATGHTHVPKQGIQNSSCLYLNCGFECPSSPDIADGNSVFNFGVIDSAGVPALWCVVKGNGVYCVGPANNGPSDQVVYAPDLDYSCYVTITNNTSNALERVTQTVDQGYSVTYPPATIAPGTTGRFWIQDLPGPFGAEGGTTYVAAVGGIQMPFVYGCPTFLDNYASGGSSFVASSGGPPDPSTPKNSVPPYGHPLFVDFTVDDGNVTGVGDWTPRSLLAHAVDAAGFLYDPRQDIIYSKMYPLQRDFGYAYGYDAAALLMAAIIDCEPIFFDYNGKTWMIEIWKGQYGLETGCEIGVYNRTIGSTSFVYGILDATVGKRSGDPSPEHNLFFDCASDSELLLMSSTLYRNGQKVFSRGPEKHWWLTGFKWGLLSEPEDLTMDVSIECLDGVMTTALVNSLTAMGYQQLQTNGNTVSFKFDTPKTHQPRADSPAAVSAVRIENQETVAAYDSLGLTSNDPNTVGDQAAATIGSAFEIYSEEFFAAVISDLANVIGTSVESLIRTLSDGFNIALNAASKYITDAEYGLETWINGIGAWLNEVLDFSSVIEISNRGGPYDLVRENYAIGHGNWLVEPPERVSAGGAGRFWLQDPKLSPEGSDGLATYTYVDSGGTKRIVMFSFNDPTGIASNRASSSSGAFNLYAKSGNIASAWNPLNSVPGGGHPLYVVFVWGTPPPPP
jgi:UDP-2,3-diacylglucosamine pyrophosphatase LpxH